MMPKKQKANTRIVDLLIATPNETSTYASAETD